MKKSNLPIFIRIGNVLATVSDRKFQVSDGANPPKVDYYTADICSSSDYYPFGSLMPDRNYSADSYRHGYQGSEMDNEINGNGNSYTTFFRQLDPRLGRWLSIDPKANAIPWESPFVSMGNNPIWHNDPLGDIWDRKKDKKMADKMDSEANTKITGYKSEISELQKAEGNEDKIKDLNARIGELESSITERAAMGSNDDPTIYRFEKWKKETGYTKKSLRIRDFGENVNVVTMKYNDMGDAFHEQLHGFKMGQRLLGKDKSKYDANEESAAKRREYSFIKRDTPLMQNGYYSITTANWVEQVRQEKDNPKMPKSYIKLANNWLEQQELPLITK